MKNVTAKDPRKPAIVAALKRKSGASKVTLLKELEPGLFRGHCLLSDGRKGFTRLGFYEVKEGTDGRLA